MKVTIDQTRCISAGRCVSTAPEVFAQREEDGIVILLIENPADELHEVAREAANLCPSRAITIED